MVLAGEVIVTGSLSLAIAPTASARQKAGFSIIYVGIVCFSVRACVRKSVPSWYGPMYITDFAYLMLLCVYVDCSGNSIVNQTNPWRKTYQL
jgi:hypothetical protein